MVTAYVEHRVRDSLRKQATHVDVPSTHTDVSDNVGLQYYISHLFEHVVAYTHIRKRATLVNTPTTQTKATENARI